MIRILIERKFPQPILGCSIILWTLILAFPSEVQSTPFFRARPTHFQDSAQKADPESSTKLAFKELTKKFQTECHKIADKASKNGLPFLADSVILFSELNQIDSDLLVQPGATKTAAFVPENLSAEQKKILSSFDDLQKDFSNQLLQLAQKIAVEGSERLSDKTRKTGFHWDSRLARRLIWLSIYYHPNNEKVRKFLGYRLKNEIWRSGKQTKITVKKGFRAHRQLRWEKKTYWTIDSGNFLILCRSNVEEAQQLILQFENWRSLWRQAMMPFWLNDNVFRSRLRDLRGLPAGSEGRHTVVLFGSRREFLLQLSHIQGIEQSVGYYDPKLRKSFFYLKSESDQSDLRSTWKHEIAHQLFQETGQHTSKPAERNNLWLMEGIAILFESMVPYHQEHRILRTNGRKVWQLGGPFARRLQFAKLRFFREGYFAELKEFWSRGRRKFQQSENIVQDYSQAAGFAQFLWEFQGGRYRPALMQMLAKLYSGRSRTDMVATLTEQSPETLTTQYKKWLSAKNKQRIQKHRYQTADTLSLPSGKLTDEDLARLSITSNLNLLCLSENQIESLPKQWLPFLSELSDLHLDINPIEDSALKTIADHCKKLNELDLTSTRISNQGLKTFSQLKNLQYLWIAGTRIDDQAIPSLLQIPNLKYLDIRKSKISPQGAETLRKKIQKVLY